MQKLILAMTLLISLNGFSAVGQTAAVESYLKSEFTYLFSYGMFFDLGPTAQCDEVISVMVKGNRGSGVTSYECEICLVEDSGVVTADSTHSECYRETH